MKFSKNNMKLIIGFLIGMVLTGGIVYAAVSASEVNYTTDKNVEIKNVEQALNDLYNKNNYNNVDWVEIQDAFVSNPNYNLIGARLYKKGNICKLSFTIENITKNTKYVLINNSEYYPKEELEVYGWGHDNGMASVKINTDGSFTVTNQSISWGSGWSAIKNICYICNN